jgi:high-affinity nickel-transport protein
VKPVRKLYYNLNITLVSVLVAVLVGTIELLSIVGPQLGLRGILWDGREHERQLRRDRSRRSSGSSSLSWFVSTAVYKLRRYDELDVAVTPVP